MNNESLDLVPDVEFSFQDRIDILFHEIEMAVKWDRPSILFAIYKSDFIRDKVIQLLEEKLNGISQNIYLLKTDEKTNFDFLSQLPQFPNLAQNVLFIDGFNWKCGEEGVNVFKELNKHREYFIDNNIRAIFWLCEKEVSDFAANATECWILRHRVVEFVDVPSEDKGSAQSLDKMLKSADNATAGESTLEIAPEKQLNTPDNEKKTASHANALLSLGIIFWRKGNQKRALKYLHAATEMSLSLTNHSLQVQCQNALGLVHSELGNLDEAVSAFQRAITLSPESGYLWNNLGKLLAKNDRNEEAIDAYKNALTCSPQDFLSWDGVGRIFIKLGVFQNAISAFEKALEIAPYNELSLAGLGKAYFESGQLDKAEAPLRKAVEINAHNIEAWIDLGKCIAQQKHFLDAGAIFHQAIEFNTQSAELWDELGMLHLSRESYPESILAFQKALTLNPQYGDVYLRLAYALFQTGDYETSASIYRESIPLFEDHVTLSELWIRLGDTYVQLKDYEKAIAAYEQSDQLHHDPKLSGENGNSINKGIKNDDLIDDQEMKREVIENGRGEKMNEANQVFDLKTAAEWNKHGNSHLKAGAYNDAIVAYTKAIELAPETCWPYIQNLANVHYEKGKARGKQTAGNNEDPDVWEGEDELDVTSLFSYVATTNSEQGEMIMEPRLEKPTRDHSIGLPSGNDDNGSADLPALEPLEEGTISNSMEDPSDVRVNTVSKEENAAPISDRGVSSPVNNPIVPLIVENTPQNSIDWNELGNSYASLKKFDNAIEAYKKAIEMNPKFGQPYSNLGFIHYRLGKYEVAVLLYKKSIELLDTQEEKAASWNRLGDAYRRLGDYGNALAAYQNASEMTPALSPVIARDRATLLENFVAG